MRLLRGELRKLVRRPASFITLGIMVGIVLLIYIAVATSYRAAGQATTPDAEQARVGIRLLLTFPGAYAGVIGLITGLGGLLALSYAAAAAGADWGWGMVKVAVARGESRSRYVLTKLGAVVIMLACGMVIAFAVGVVAAFVAALLAGVDTSGIGDAAVVGTLPEQIGRGFLGIAEQGAVGFVVATLARSQIAGLGAGIALYFVEQFSTIFLPGIVRYLPFHVASSALRVQFGSSAQSVGSTQALDPTLAVALVVAYFVVAAVGSAIAVERAEITG